MSLFIRKKVTLNIKFWSCTDVVTLVVQTSRDLKYRNTFAFKIRSKSQVQQNISLEFEKYRKSENTK